MGDEHVGDARVVVDDALGSPGRGIQHLVEVRQLEAVFVYRHRLVIGSHASIVTPRGPGVST